MRCREKTVVRIVGITHIQLWEKCSRRYMQKKRADVSLHDNTENIT